MRLLMRAVMAAALAGLLLGGAARADDKKPDEKKPDEKKKKDKAPAEMLPDIEKLLEALGNQRGLNDEQMKELREQMKKMRQQMLQMQKGGLQGGGFGGFGGLQVFPAIPNLPNARRESSQEARLGVKLAEPTEALIDQLDLPKGQGMVLEEVTKDSPAGKAGLKAHDILLEVNGKAVPAKKAELVKVLVGVEGGKAFDVVVLRKGKKETIKGLKFEEAKRGQRQGFGGDGQTQIQRNNDEFEATLSKDGVKITVSGKVKDGKATASDIVIRTDGKSKTYESVDKVPAEHQEAVKKLLEKSGKGLQFRFGFDNDD